MQASHTKHSSRLISEDQLFLGKGLDADEHVIIGYVTGHDTGGRSVRLGENARLRSGTIIYGDVTIGKNFETGHHTLIRENNNIGDDVCIWSNTVIDYGCNIGHRVKIHCNVYIPQFTVLRDDVFIAPGCTFANDVYPGCPESKKRMQGPVLEAGVQIGVNVTILPAVNIGDHTLIGSGSVVTCDIPPKSVAWGNPARVHKSIEELNCCSGVHSCIYTQPGQME